MREGHAAAAQVCVGGEGEGRRRARGGNGRSSCCCWRRRRSNRCQRRSISGTSSSGSTDRNRRRRPKRLLLPPFMPRDDLDRRGEGGVLRPLRPLRETRAHALSGPPGAEENRPDRKALRLPGLQGPVLAEGPRCIVSFGGGRRSGRRMGSVAGDRRRRQGRQVGPPQAQVQRQGPADAEARREDGADPGPDYRGGDQGVWAGAADAGEFLAFFFFRSRSRVERGPRRRTSKKKKRITFSLSLFLSLSLPLSLSLSYRRSPSFAASATRRQTR